MTSNLIMVPGPRGGAGKSFFANLGASTLEAAGHDVLRCRFESFIRQGHVPDDEVAVDVDKMLDAADVVGGSTAVFDDFWEHAEAALAAKKIVMIDLGTPAVNPFYRMAADVRLAAYLADCGLTIQHVVVVPPDLDSMESAPALIEEIESAFPRADILLALNAWGVDGDLQLTAAQQVAYDERLRPLLDRFPQIRLPRVADRALEAFPGRSLHAVMSAPMPELKAWSGLPTLSARHSQTRIGSFMNAVGGDLARVLRFHQ